MIHWRISLLLRNTCFEHLFKVVIYAVIIPAFFFKKWDAFKKLLKKKNQLERCCSQLDLKSIYKLCWENTVSRTLKKRKSNVLLTKKVKFKNLCRSADIKM